jgi:hypothetical protein
MNVSYLENHLKSGGVMPTRIVDEMDIYKFKLDKRALNTLNKVLGTDFKAVFRREYHTQRPWSAKELSVDTGSVFVIRSNNTVMEFHNSEWFTIHNIEAHTYGG